MLIQYTELTNVSVAPKLPHDLASHAKVTCHRIVHQQGRRYRIAARGLKGSSALASRLNRIPMPTQGIVSLQANAVTGNVLVETDRNISAANLFAMLDGHLEKAMRRLVADAEPAGLKLVSNVGKTEHAADGGIQLPETDLTRGLNTEQVKTLMESVGPNIYDFEHRIDKLTILKDQLYSVPNAVLAGSAVLALISRAVVDAIFVGTVVALNAAVGFKTALSAERSINAMGNGASDVVRVLRAGKWERLAPELLLPGDVIRLESGVVPADAVLTAADGLTVDESSLTGESAAVQKFPGPVAATTPMADRTNMVFAGTVITGGSATAVVTSTGLNTEMGRVRQLTAQRKHRPPLLQKQLDDLGKASVRNTAIACAGYFALGLMRGIPLKDMLKSAASLAVAAVPEGLTAVGTASFAQGISRMRRRGIFSRDLRAIETIGSSHYLCLDKTGTITTNEMIAEKIFSEFRTANIGTGSEDDGPSAGALQQLAKIALLCNDARKDNDGKFTGSATEVALFKFAESVIQNAQETRKKHERINTAYRSNSRRFMATTFRTADGSELETIKGDPHAVLAHCDFVHEGDDFRPLFEEERATVVDANQEMSANGYRVLALAYRFRERGSERHAVSPMIFSGLVALKNPVRRGVRSMIRELRACGIKPVLITGDQTPTALSVAKELGFNGEFPLHAVDATTLQGLSEAEREETVRSAQVFARVSPEEKLKVIRLLQKDGSVVAMTGDGINDSPALRAADVGVAMGMAGTNAARETADLVISDDDLTHILHAVAEGRSIRRNLEDVTRFLLTTNFCETIITIAATLWTGRCSLSPLQLLWVNTITDVFPALAMIAKEPDDDLKNTGVVRPDAPFFGGDQLATIYRDALVMAVTPALVLGLRRKGTAAMGLMALVTGQMAYAANFGCRGKPSRGVAWTALASVAVQTLLPFSPLGRVLGLNGATAGGLITSAALGALPAIICNGDVFRRQNINNTVRPHTNGGSRNV